MLTDTQLVGDGGKMNKVEPKTLSGFMELMPQEQIMFDKIKNTIEEIYSKYGFYNLDTPIIESSEVLLAKAGGETEKQIYRFTKGDNDLSLRFDLTVPLAKYVAKRYNDLIFPFKRYQIGKVYRGERPQKGRFREFYQCDIDVIGNESLSLLYDAEIPSIIYDIFKKLDFGDFVIRINNRKILSGFFTELGLNNKITEILRIVDKLEKIGVSNIKEELKEEEISTENIDKIINFITRDGSSKEKIAKLKELDLENNELLEGIKELEFVIEKLDEMNLDKKCYEVDLTIARGLDYYTGTVYETKLKEYPNIGSVCSGGRYDDLASYYTDKKLPGVGISIGLTRLFYQLQEANLLKEDNTSVSQITILPMTDNYEYVYKVSNTFRNSGFKVDTCYLENSNFKKKMRYVDKHNSPYVVIIGDNEIEKNVVTIKNMKTGNQKEILISLAVDEINKI